MFVFDVASPKAAEKWGLEFGKHPVGTGAFQFVEWKPNQEVILEANPGYWGVKPKVKRVVGRNIKDNAQRLGALKAGEIHGMEGLNPDDVAVVKSDPSLQLSCVRRTPPATSRSTTRSKSSRTSGSARRSRTPSTRRPLWTRSMAAPASSRRSSSPRRSGATTGSSKTSSTARPERRNFHRKPPSRRGSLN